VSGNITELLAAWRGGSAEAGQAIIADTYQELRRVAHYQIRRERPGHTLQTTALLHEAYLRLLRRGPGSTEDRQAFFRLMASEMRHRLVDHARRHAAAKRGGGRVHERLEVATTVTPRTEPDLEIESTLDRLDDALKQLADAFPRAADVVQLRFLVGLTTEETAKQLSLSAATVKRDWTFARAWLAAAITSASVDSDR
jgi:RNA polymerase sigma factor (TIGR02999 family)